MSTTDKSEGAVEFGQWLSRQRKARDLTQEDLAQRTGCSLSSLQKIEVGNRRPSKQMVEILADFFGIEGSERESFLLFARGHASGESSGAEAANSDSAVVSKYPSPFESASEVPNNLPAQLTSFVGRDVDLARVRDMLLTSEIRLLTLTGPPGTGKTRLALQVASALLKENEFRDGIYFVNLAPIWDPALVLTEVAQTIGTREGVTKSLVEALKEFLKDRQLLLVLDNFEQVVKAAPSVAELLMSAPRVKILATSRALLQVRGERNYPVPPMELPSMQAGERELDNIPLDQLSRYEAVRLFIERAEAVRPDFSLNREDAPSLVKICYRLDGLPLAIELAAARTTLFSPQAMLSRLESRLKLLTGGARDLAARQQTLRGAIDWSYNLLDPEEQQLFRRLSVFQGGRTFEAVEAVCNAWGDLKVDVLNGLASLVEKNLLQQRTGCDGEPRFVMLETIHEYAKEKLQESGEGQQLEREHALYFMTFAEGVEPHLLKQHQQKWFDKLADEYDNLRSALAWARKQSQIAVANGVSRVGRGTDKLPANGELLPAEIGLRTAGAMWRLWLVRGLYTEGREHMEGLLTLPEVVLQECSSGHRVKVGGAAGALSLRQGDYTAARALLEKAITLGREAGDKQNMSLALNSLGIVAFDERDYPLAGAMYSESLGLYRETGDKWGTAATLNNLGIVAFEQGDYSAARALHDESLDLFRELGERRGTAVCLNNLGNMAAVQGDYQEARACHIESLTLQREIADMWGLAASLAGLGGIAVRQGRAQDVVEAQQAQVKKGTRILGAVEGLLQSIGGVLGGEDGLSYERVVALARDFLGEAEFERARQEGYAMSLEEAVTYALDAEISDPTIRANNHGY